MRVDVEPAALDAFEDELRAGGIATRVLEARAGGRVRAEAVGRSSVALPPELRTALDCAANEGVAHRRTRLMHGEATLSEAELWYLPARLSAAMNHALAVTDTPFGVVIADLMPTRRTLAIERLGEGDGVLRVRAVVIGEDGRPLALAEESYRRAALGLD